MIFKGKEIVTLNATDIINMDGAEIRVKIENLTRRIIELQHTNPVGWKCSEKFQEMADYQNHSDIAVLLGELTAYVYELEGLDGILNKMNEIRMAHQDYMRVEYEKFYKFRESYPEQWNEFSDK